MEAALFAVGNSWGYAVSRNLLGKKTFFHAKQISSRCHDDEGDRHDEETHQLKFDVGKTPREYQ